MKNVAGILSSRSVRKIDGTPSALDPQSNVKATTFFFVGSLVHSTPSIDGGRPEGVVEGRELGFEGDGEVGSEAEGEVDGHGVWLARVGGGVGEPLSVERSIAELGAQAERKMASAAVRLIHLAGSGRLIVRGDACRRAGRLRKTIVPDIDLAFSECLFLLLRVPGSLPSSSATSQTGRGERSASSGTVGGTFGSPYPFRVQVANHVISATVLTNLQCDTVATGTRRISPRDRTVRLKGGF
jgi:hypothetical protein